MNDQAPPAYSGPDRVLSGVQPSGALHLGNYLGALLAFASHERAWLEAPLRGFHLIGLGAKEIAVLGVAAVGVAVYGLLLLAFRGITPSEIKTALRRRPGDAAVAADL